MSRDCEHGCQVGKCADCDVAELEQENRLLRARNERLELELELLHSINRVNVEQRDKCWAELNALAQKVASRLEQSGAGASASLIRDVFIHKTHS